MSDLWVFGYGSLMWRPGFPHEEAVDALIGGVHRALCVYSWVHRGTKARPGLVLGLDRGGSCRGIAFRIAPASRDGVIAYLRERELVTSVYREVQRDIRLLRGRIEIVVATTFVVDRSHEQYAGDLSREKLLDLVRDSRGLSGANADYVLNTARHLRTLGLRDPVLDWLAEKLTEDAASTQPV